jgi:small conductance mechanosensitive channel
MEFDFNTDTLKEIWEDYQVSLTILFIVAGSWLLTRLTRYLLTRSMQRVYEGDRTSATAINFLKNTVSGFFFVVATIAVVYTIPALRTLADTLTIGAGVVAAVVAFASQTAFSNLIGGLFIVIFRPFRVGDRIFIGKDYEGMIEDITLRHTVIRDWEQKRIIIPNSVISKETIVNSDFSGEYICRFVEIPISYDSDFEQAIELIREQAMAHPSYVDVRKPEEIARGDPPFMVRVIRYTDSGAILRVYLWGDLASTFVMAADLRLNLQKAFQEAGIRMGVPHRLWYAAADAPVRLPDFTT